MTNAMKHKTAEERTKAFHAFCDSHGDTCDGCPFLDKQCVSAYDIRAAFAWLELEAEVEQPLPCPFCGSETFYANDRGIIYCKVCEYRSNKYKWSHEAIAEHNRVARAVMAKDKEAK